MKKLQIVRVDSDSVQKADLKLGNNIIGRGVATGVMPCYMKSVGAARWILLQIGSTIPIHTGDLFSLLSDQFWFKLVSVEDTMEEEDTTLKRQNEESTEEEPPQKKIRPEGSVEALLSPHGNLEEVPSSIGVDPGNEDLNTVDYDETALATSEEQTTKDIYGASAPDEGEPSIFELSTDFESSSPEPSNEPAVPQTTSPSPQPLPTNESVVSKDSEQNLESQEKNASPDNEESEKKIKWDCGRHFSDQSDQAIGEETELPDPAQPFQTTPNDAAASSAAEPSHSATRNRCTYGRKCYRQNAEHRAQFSHPGDPDYNVPDNRPECYYGVRCYRKNPQHRKDYKHTVERRGRPQTPVRARTPEATSGTDQSSFEESIDESEYEPSYCTDSSDDGKCDSDDK